MRRRILTLPVCDPAVKLLRLFSCLTKYFLACKPDLFRCAVGFVQEKKHKKDRKHSSKDKKEKKKRDRHGEDRDTRDQAGSPDLHSLRKDALKAKRQEPSV